MSKLDVRISLWNYFHYRLKDFVPLKSMEEEVKLVKDAGYGIELWCSWSDRAKENFYTQKHWEWLKKITDGMKVSMHGRFCAINDNDFEGHKQQIDTAAYVGADALVVHAQELLLISEQNLKPDFEYGNKVVDYAKSKGVRIALENGELNMLKGAIDNIKDLNICIDIGHVYFTDDPMEIFFDLLGERIIHFHFQDIIRIPEVRDHYCLGTGEIPAKDWKIILDFIKQSKRGLSITLEIRPRDPLLLAKQSLEFVKSMM